MSKENPLWGAPRILVMQAADQGMRHDARHSRVFESEFSAHTGRILHVEQAN